MIMTLCTFSKELKQNKDSIIFNLDERISVYTGSAENYYHHNSVISHYNLLAMTLNYYAQTIKEICTYQHLLSVCAAFLLLQ